MKKILAIALAFLLCISLGACSSKIVMTEAEEIVLTFKYADKEISQVLTAEERETVCKILDGKRSLDMAKTENSCGFDPRVALTVDGVIYAMSRDDCCMLQNLHTDEIIIVSEEEYSQLVAIFETYGGYFPCL